ncbi:hypothetical protein AMST5_00401 [freshwater sediment metagenome]|uniref:Uncharacterized protein n=1 Tax=freshwater sediment metagenome TaxID=556182 RepID=A0AA48M095_9ZZZZ
MRRKVPALGVGETSLDPADLPSFTRDKILYGARWRGVARAGKLPGELFKLLRRLFRHAHRERCQGVFLSIR